jgi:hypothetical protein
MIRAAARAGASQCRSGRRRLMSSIPAMESTQQEQSSDIEAFKRIAFSRVSMKNFLSKEVPEDVLKAILSVTQVCIY